MARKKKLCASGIGGQAVLEGVMMKNQDLYAVAVRKPDGEIEIDTQEYHGVLHGSKIKKIPFVRGVFNFLDSLILGMRTLTYSAEFYEDEEAKETAGQLKEKTAPYVDEAKEQLKEDLGETKEDYKSLYQKFKEWLNSD